jgi:hypothetical protein
MLLLNHLESAVSFIPRTSTTFPTRCTTQAQTPTRPILFSKKDSESSTTKEADPLAKGAWYAVEAFGNLFGAATTRKEDEEGPNNYSLDEPPKSLQETLQRIKDDNDRSYFLSGEVDRLIHDEMCTFSDPFVSFEGRDRFISNLANLGSFITKYSVRPLGYEVQEDGFVKTKVNGSIPVGDWDQL